MIKSDLLCGLKNTYNDIDEKSLLTDSSSRDVASVRREYPVRLENSLYRFNTTSERCMVVLFKTDRDSEAMSGNCLRTFPESALIFVQATAFGV